MIPSANIESASYTSGSTGFDPLAGDWFAAAAERFAERIAISDHTGVGGGKPAEISYGELNRMIADAVDELKRRYAFQPGDAVAVLDENRLEHIVLLFACLRGGFRFVPLNHRLKSVEIAHQLETAGVRALLFGPGYHGDGRADFENLSSGSELEFRDSLDEWSPESGQWRTHTDGLASGESPSAQDDWIVLFTSGTTGKPRAARLSRRMVLWNNIHTLQGWNLGAADRGLVHTPLFHAGGLNVLTTPLLFCGGRVHLESGFNAKRVLELVRRREIDLLFAVPTMFQLMSTEPSFADTDFSSLRLIISGGAPCSAALMETYRKRGAQLRQGFGMTEAGVNCFFMDAESVHRKIGAVGRPMLFSRATLTSEQGEIVQGEGEGRLWLSGPHLFSGYMGVSPAETFHAQHGFNTGDVARRDEDGYYYIVGRTKDIIIRGGENIYPAEVEPVLAEYPALKETVIVGREDETWGEIPVAVVTLEDRDTAIDAAHFLSFCKERMSSYKIPHRLFVMADIPRTDSGKIAGGIVRELVRKLREEEMIKIK